MPSQLFFLIPRQELSFGAHVGWQVQIIFVEYLHSLIKPSRKLPVQSRRGFLERHSERRPALQYFQDEEDAHDFEHSVVQPYEMTSCCHSSNAIRTMLCVFFTKTVINSSTHRHPVHARVRVGSSSC